MWVSCWFPAWCNALQKMHWILGWTLPLCLSLATLWTYNIRETPAYMVLCIEGTPIGRKQAAVLFLQQSAACGVTNLASCNLHQPLSLVGIEVGDHADKDEQQDLPEPRVGASGRQVSDCDFRD